jgi:hypothetical protein
MIHGSITTLIGTADELNALLDDPEQGEKSVRVLSGGTVVELKGFLTDALADKLAATLKAHPKVSSIILNSPGGRWSAGQKMADLVKLCELDTIVKEECSSMCTNVFLAGRQRLIAKNAVMGFHRPTSGGQDALQFTQEDIDAAKSAGAPDWFVHRAYRHRLWAWYPSPEVLRQAHIATGTYTGP